MKKITDARTIRLRYKKPLKQGRPTKMSKAELIIDNFSIFACKIPQLKGRWTNIICSISPMEGKG